ncbi:MAG: DUF3795 domain-containing protein [Candidatus Aminicenantes bacterium]|nr:MAG: DUF3795 domain-containing protein [Candidatus Aminicenantes bacterium]
MSKTKHYDNVKDQIGYCGIWCGSCVAGSGVLQELTRRYDKIINDYGLEQWAPKDFDFKEFVKGLQSIQNMPRCPGCVKGGGRDDCEIRACALDKDLADCSECARPENCENKELLETMQKGAEKAGLMVKTDKTDRNELLEKWIEQIKSKWSSSILFQNE